MATRKEHEGKHENLFGPSFRAGFNPLSNAGAGKLEKGGFDGSIGKGFSKFIDKFEKGFASFRIAGAMGNQEIGQFFLRHEILMKNKEDEIIQNERKDQSGPRTHLHEA